MSIPDIGSIWIDRDSRMAGRRVRVTHASKYVVHYCSASGLTTRRDYTSKTERFVKAFKPDATTPGGKEGK